MFLILFEINYCLNKKILSHVVEYLFKLFFNSLLKSYLFWLLFKRYMFSIVGLYLLLLLRDPGLLAGDCLGYIVRRHQFRRGVADPTNHEVPLHLAADCHGPRARDNPIGARSGLWIFWTSLQEHAWCLQHQSQWNESLDRGVMWWWRSDV